MKLEESVLILSILLLSSVFALCVWVQRPQTHVITVRVFESYSGGGYVGVNTYGMGHIIFRGYYNFTDGYTYKITYETSWFYDRPKLLSVEEASPS